MTYENIRKRLAECGIDNADTEAALLLEHFVGANRALLLSEPRREYASKALSDAVEQRASRYPLQYILGEWGFYDEVYTVNENCLVPRSDTELLVEFAIHHLPPNAFFADLCTGSGCIAVSTLAHREDCHAVCVDLYEKTLALAKENAARNRVAERLSFRLADVLSGDALKGEDTADAILCNPPYIRSEVIRDLEKELFFEPSAALDGGDDGLVFYRALLTHYAGKLKKDGFFLFEIGYDQKEAIELLAEDHGFFCRVYPDLAGNPRMAYLFRNRKEANV